MGMGEYDVALAEASSKEDMAFVANAFIAGQSKERARIEKEFLSRANGYNNIYISIEEIRKIINEA